MLPPPPPRHPHPDLPKWLGLEPTVNIDEAYKQHVIQTIWDQYSTLFERRYVALPWKNIFILVEFHE